jgi:hypothetical protein
MVATTSTWLSVKGLQSDRSGGPDERPGPIFPRLVVLPVVLNIPFRVWEISPTICDLLLVMFIDSVSLEPVGRMEKPLCVPVRDLELVPPTPI